MECCLPFVLMFLAVLLSSFSQILLKKSAMKEYKAPIYEYLNLYVIFGYSITFGSMLLMVVAYSMTEYKNGPMIEASGFVIVLVLSRFFFGEKLTRKKLLGSSLIVAGILIFYL